MTAKAADQPDDFQRYADLFAAEEGALMAGQSSEVTADSTELEQRLREDLDCVRLLREALRRSAGASYLAAPATCGLPWRRLGRFELRRELGRGGFGIVYLAYDPVLNREVALKVPRAEVASRPELRERFYTEAQAAAGLEHPNIVPVYEGGEVGPVCFLVSAYCPGITLAQWLKELAEPLPFRDAAALVAALSEAVQHAHQRGVIHRDLKPSNVLLVKRVATNEPRENSGYPPLAAFHPRITDFGLAKFYGESTGNGATLSGAILGTVEYMAPEQAAGKTRRAGPPADTYALGVILYELLIGRPPLRGETALETLQYIQAYDPVPPARLRPKVPRDLETICLKCLQIEPERRYRTAQELADDLHRWLGNEPIRARRVSRLGKLWRWSRRNPALAAASSLAVTAAVGMLALAIGFAIHRSQAAEKLFLEQQQTKRALAKSEQQYRLSERRSALLSMERGLTLCEQGQIGRGMLWLARSLEIAAKLTPDVAGDLERITRANLAHWRQELIPLRGLFAHQKGAGGVAFSPDCALVATAGFDGTARLWEVASGRSTGLPMQTFGGCACVTFSPDGKLLLTGGASHTANLWDAATGKPRGPTLRHQSIVESVAFSPDGRTIATGTRDGSACLWETATGQPTASLPSHEGSIVALVFSPEGKTIATASFDGTARLYETPSGTPVCEPLRHPPHVRAVAFNPDGKSLLTGGEDGAARFWLAATGEPIGSPLEHPAGVYAVAFAPDGKTIVTASNDRMTRFWSLASRKPLGKSLPHPNVVGALAVSSDGRLLVTCAAGDPARVWQIVPNDRLAPPLEHPDRVRAIAFSPDGRTILTGCQDSLARFWDAATGKLRGPTIRHASRVLTVAFSPDGKTVLTGSHDKTAQLWEAETGTAIGEPLVHPVQVNAVAFSRDGRTVLTGCEDGRARIWDTTTGKLLGSVLDDSGALQAAGYNPDGRTIVTCSGSVHFWDADTLNHAGDPLRPQPHGTVMALAFHPDGRTLLTGGTNMAAQQWDLATRGALGLPLEHQASVIATAYSPDGRIICTGSHDNVARLWDAATGKPIGPPLVHEGGVEAVVFSPDIRTLATASWDKTVRLWSVPVPMEGRADTLSLWVQVLTGLKLDADGVVRVLDTESWQQCKRRLHEVMDAF